MQSANQYKRMIDPHHAVVDEFSKLLIAPGNRRDLVERIIELLKPAVTFDDSATGFQPFDEVMRNGRGNCLALSCLLCSILRANGFPYEDIYVIIGGDYAFYRESAHAWTIIKLDSDIVVIDPEKMQMEDKDSLGSKTIYLYFNDQRFIVGANRKVETVI